MNFLSIFLLLCVTVLCVKCHEQVFTKERAHTVANECKDEVGATDADVDAMFRRETAGTAEAKCLRACGMKKYGIMDDNGKMVKDIAIVMLNAIAKGDTAKETASKEALDICSTIEVSKDHCEAAAEYGVCMRKEAKERGVQFAI